MSRSSNKLQGIRCVAIPFTPGLQCILTGKPLEIQTENATMIPMIRANFTIRINQLTRN
jgi:hypothetical protein